jgi:hypothetical protein
MCRPARRASGKSAQPAFASRYSTLGHWLASLDRLAALEPVLIVPSHGPTAGHAEFIDRYRSYLIEVRDRTAAEKRAGKSADQAVEAVIGALASRNPDRGRLVGRSGRSTRKRPERRPTSACREQSTLESSPPLSGINRPAPDRTGQEARLPALGKLQSAFEGEVEITFDGLAPDPAAQKIGPQKFAERCGVLGIASGVLQVACERAERIVDQVAHRVGNLLVACRRP